MAGYQTIEALRPILHKGPPATPVVNRALVAPQKPAYVPRYKGCATVADVEQMIALREKGHGTYDIAKRTGFSRSTVQSHVRHVVVPEHLKIRGRPRQEYDVALAERLWREGKTYQAIADAVGAHKSAVYVRLNGRSPNAKPRPVATYSKRKDRHLDEIVSRVTGLTISELRGRAPSKTRAARARVILQWLMRHKHPERSYMHIARACGLTDHSGTRNAFLRVEQIVALFKINVRGQTEVVVRQLWEAEWPKASA